MSTIVELLKTPLRRIVAGGVVLLVIIGGFVLLGHHSDRANPPGVGIAKRVAPDLHGVATGTATSDCFTGDVVGPAGRVGGVQHYSLTLQLRSTPASPGDLVQLLSQKACTDEQAKISAAVMKALSIDPTTEALVVTYTSPDGSRVLLPT